MGRLIQDVFFNTVSGSTRSVREAKRCICPTFCPTCIAITGVAKKKRLEYTGPPELGRWVIEVTIRHFECVLWMKCVYLVRVPGLLGTWIRLEVD
jgi:hypothetical protein